MAKPTLKGAPNAGNATGASAARPVADDAPAVTDAEIEREDVAAIVQEAIAKIPEAPAKAVVVAKPKHLHFTSETKVPLTALNRAAEETRNRRNEESAYKRAQTALAQAFNRRLTGNK